MLPPFFHLILPDPRRQLGPQTAIPLKGAAKSALSGLNWGTCWREENGSS